MNKHLRMIFIGVFTISIASIEYAHAALITVNDNITESVFLDFGSISGHFDIATELSPVSQYNSPYSITSATATFYFQDDGDLELDSTFTFDYEYVNSSDGWDYFQRNIIDSYVDYAEVGKVSFYGNTSPQVSSLISNSYSNGFTFTGYDQSNGVWYDYFTGNDIYYTALFDEEYGNTGEWAINIILNDDSLAELSNFGAISFSSEIVNGDAYFINSVLTVNVEPNPIEESVPESSTMMLVAFGLFGVGFRRKK